MPTVAELKRADAQLAQQRKQIREALGGKPVLTVEEERERDAQRKRAKRENVREVIIPRCKDRRRRDYLEKDDINWLRFYYGPNANCPDPFWYPFTA